MLENRNILCFGFAEWDNPYRTNQHHLMERLSKNNRVLFIESLGLRRPTLQRKDLGRIGNRLKKSLKGIRKVDENLYVFSPLVFPFHKYSAVRLLNRIVLKAQLAIVIARLKFDSPIIWSYVPNAADFLGDWKEKVSVYHCVDELSANPLIPARAVLEMEERFLSKVDIVFTTSKSLFERKKKFNKNTYYLPNVADFAHFNTATLEASKIPEDIAQIPSPRIGFIGAISGYKLDFGFIATLARKHPDWAFVLIGVKGEGEKEADISELEKESNIHLLGGRPYDLLPGYLKGFDVCLLPNKLNDYTKNMFPMKFFEYLSAGKPVVATMLESLEEFGDYCYLSKGKEEFERNIENALKEDRSIREKRVALARKYTWDARIQEMDGIIESHIK